MSRQILVFVFLMAVKANSAALPVLCNEVTQPTNLQAFTSPESFASKKGSNIFIYKRENVQASKLFRNSGPKSAKLVAIEDMRIELPEESSFLGLEFFSLGYEVLLVEKSQISLYDTRKTSRKKNPKPVFQYPLKDSFFHKQIGNSYTSLSEREILFYSRSSHQLVELGHHKTLKKHVQSFTNNSLAKLKQVALLKSEIFGDFVLTEYQSTNNGTKKDMLGVYSLEEQTLLEIPLRQIFRTEDNALVIENQVFSYKNGSRWLDTPASRENLPMVSIALPLGNLNNPQANSVFQTWLTPYEVKVESLRGNTLQILLDNIR